MNPEIMQMLAALQGNQGAQAPMMNAQNSQNVMGNPGVAAMNQQQGSLGSQPDMYSALAGPPPMTPPPSPIY